MKEIKSILAPTDYSEASCYAMDYAFYLGSVFKAKLILLHVFEEREIAVFKGMLYEISKDLEENVRHIMEKRLEEQSFSHLEKEFVRCVPEEYRDERVPFRRLIRKGTPYLEIIKVAEEEKADLIIMGRHGRSGLKSVLIGSVTEKVYRNSRCPVLIVGEFEDTV